MKMKPGLLILFACVVLAGCATRPAPQAVPEPQPAPSAAVSKTPASEPDEPSSTPSAPEKANPDTAAVSEPEPMPAVTEETGAPLNIDEKTLRVIDQMMRNRDRGDDRPQKGLEGFLKQNEKFTSYPNYRMLWTYGIDSEIYRYDRINRFFESHKAGVPDELGIIQSGDPIPSFVVELITDGKTMTARNVWPEHHPEPKPAVPQETKTEWIIPGDNELRYAKYGLVPTLIAGAPHQATRAEAQQAVYDWALAECDWLPEDFKLSAREDEMVAGETCWVYSDQEGGNVFAVSPDMSFFYEMEQVNGNYVLELTPAASPEAFAAAKKPSGPITRIRE